MLQQMVLFTFLVPDQAVASLQPDHPCTAALPDAPGLHALVIGAAQPAAWCPCSVAFCTWVPV